MNESRGFSMETVRRAGTLTPTKRFSDKFSDEDIERALRQASIKVGKFVMPEERR